MKSSAKFYLRHNFLMNREIKKINGYFETDDFEEIKNRRFLKLFEQVKTNEFYSDFYKDIDLYKIHSIEDLHLLPVLTKTDVRENIGKILNRNPLFVTKDYTSGTTGSPLTIYRDLPAIIKENAYVWWYRMEAGLRPKDKKISLRGDLDRNKLFQFERVSNTLFISSYNLNEKNLSKIVHKIREFNPKAILAYPSSAFTLATLLDDYKLDLHIPLTFTSSESLLSFQYEKITKILNTKLHDWYGTAERTIALYAENGHYYEPPLYSVNEYQLECILTTSLINTSFPLLRYQVNDVIEHKNIYNSSKKSIEINHIIGRIDDYIYLEDGTKIGRISLTLKGVRGIKNAQIIQESMKALTINIVPAGKVEKEKLLKNLRHRLGDRISIQINEISEDQLVLSPSRKFKFVISKI